MKKIKGILFDLDGTLLDTTSLIIKSFEYAFTEVCKRQITATEIFPFFGKPLRAAMESLAPDRVEELLQAFRKYNLANHDEMVAIFPGIAKTLCALKAEGLKLAIVTSKTSKTALRGLQLFDLEKYFNVIIGMEDCQQHKPHPEPVLKALQKLELTPNECLMVGDSPFDIISAHQAGVNAVAVSWTHVDWPDLIASEPEYLIDNIEELKAICNV